jgi:tRNA threonylcarbamoyladenosine biosynthesis protein TsaB
MTLDIDTTSNKQTIVKLGTKKLVWDSTVWRSQVVLPMIKKLLEDSKRPLTDISEIKVHPGPGSFTGLRVGAAIANALAYILGVKVNKKDFVSPKY